MMIKEAAVSCESRKEEGHPIWARRYPKKTFHKGSKVVLEEKEETSTATPLLRTGNLLRDQVQCIVNPPWFSRAS